MPKIDIDNYIEQSGMRKARFGGYEPDDVRQAMRELCADYEQHLAAAAAELRTVRQENDALRRHAQTLVMQNQNLSAQNATLAGQVDKLQSYRTNLETQYSTAKERNHSLTNQLDVLRLKNSDLVRENKELTEQCEEANSALRVKGRAHDQARQQVIADRDKVIAEAEGDAARIRQQARDDDGDEKERQRQPQDIGGRAFRFCHASAPPFFCFFCLTAPKRFGTPMRSKKPTQQFMMRMA